jgi:hypothetical protein
MYRYCGHSCCGTLLYLSIFMVHLGHLDAVTGSFQWVLT